VKRGWGERDRTSNPHCPRLGDFRTLVKQPITPNSLPAAPAPPAAITPFEPLSTYNMDLLTIIRKWGPGSPSKGASDRKESATKPDRELVSHEDTQRLPHKIQQLQKPTRDSRHQTLSNVPECTDGKQSTTENSIDHEMELDESQSLETITKRQNEIAEYRHQIASFQKCIEKLKNEKSQDVQEFERVVRKQNHCLEELDSKRRRQHKEHEILRQEYESLLNDNQALRDYIDRTRNRQPVHSDDEYIARMGSLNHKTKSWITSLSKSRRSEDLELDYSIIQEALGWNSYGRHFQSWVNEDPNRLRSILQKSQHRTFLIRQLIWSEFSETIFSPFCLGLRNEVDHLLHKIMDEICVQGTDSLRCFY